MILKKHRIPIYGGQLWICITNSFDKSVDAIEDKTDIILDRNKNDLRKTAAITYQFYDGDGKFRILIILKPNSTVSYISHEALHAVNWIFSHCGIKYSLTNDEPQCYLLGWIVQKIMDTIELEINKQ